MYFGWSRSRIRSENSALLMRLFQRPSRRAPPIAPKKMPSRTAANRAGLTGRERVGGVFTCSALVTGQAATHERQPMHSSEVTRPSRSTGRFDGHAFVQSEQSMHVAAFRVIFRGENNETHPRSAP